ncbi:MAG: glucosaminidase domain-containing protein [Bacteroidales bacterium]|nr:glucosaminidase domain-containing protein [Bacteroidales bacterium]
MMKVRLGIKGTFFITVLFLISSCRSQRPVTVAPSGDYTAAAYIEKYRDLAVREMKRTGIPASITLAQGMIESDYGRSRLAREGNNHFGIKCHNGWTGPAMRHHDDRRNECFRVYRSPEESYYDHSDFLKTGSRYSFLFDLPATDYKAWAKGLKKAGYATDPDYANMLIRKIEEHRLYNYDRGYTPSVKAGAQQAPQKVISADPAVKDTAPPAQTVPANIPDQRISYNIPAVQAKVPRVMENNRIQYIIVKDGETAESIEMDFELLKWELVKYNELGEGFVPVPGQMLYLQPKRDKAEPGKETHTAREGETMYQISQLYGVKLKKLYEYNVMDEGSQPSPGQKIWLRGMKPVTRQQ